MNEALKEIQDEKRALEAEISKMINAFSEKCDAYVNSIEIDVHHPYVDWERAFHSVHLGITL
jgi:hypothetical protein